MNSSNFSAENHSWNKYILHNIGYHQRSGLSFPKLILFQISSKQLFYSWQLNNCWSRLSIERKMAKRACCWALLFIIFPRIQSDGRAQPTRDDHMEFLVALNSAAAAGGLPLQMLHFHKYLVKHGPEDGFPLVEKDLLFYLEVHKFKVRNILCVFL